MAMPPIRREGILRNTSDLMRYRRATFLLFQKTKLKTLESSGQQEHPPLKPAELEPKTINTGPKVNASDQPGEGQPPHNIEEKSCK